MLDLDLLPVTVLLRLLALELPTIFSVSFQLEAVVSVVVFGFAVGILLSSLRSELSLVVRLVRHGDIGESREAEIEIVLR